MTHSFPTLRFSYLQTQSFPGMEEPAQGPLPGNYDMQLVSDSSPTGMSGKDITMIVAAVMAAAVGIGEIGRAHVCTPVTTAHLVCRLLLEKTKTEHNVTQT